jgi:small subunit ribosomal protein S3
MGQKVNPISFRLALKRKWKSFWYANKKEFGTLLLLDKQLRDYLMKKPCCQGTSEITVKRMQGRLEITFKTHRPGLIIGKKGSEIDQLKADIAKMTGLEIWIEVEEVKRPDLDAQLIASSIASQLQRRVAFRRAMKKAMQQAMEAGATGIKIQVSGRLNGAEIARTERYMQGSVPLHELKADIHYATARAETTYGSLGVKVWTNLGKFITSKGEGA